MSKLKVGPALSKCFLEFIDLKQGLHLVQILELLIKLRVNLVAFFEKKQHKTENEGITRKN